MLGSGRCQSWGVAGGSPPTAGVRGSRHPSAPPDPCAWCGGCQAPPCPAGAVGRGHQGPPGGWQPVATWRGSGAAAPACSPCSSGPPVGSRGAAAGLLGPPCQRAVGWGPGDPGKGWGAAPGGPPVAVAWPWVLAGGCLPGGPQASQLAKGRRDPRWVGEVGAGGAAARHGCSWRSGAGRGGARPAPAPGCWARGWCSHRCWLGRREGRRGGRRSRSWSPLRRPRGWAGGTGGSAHPRSPQGKGGTGRGRASSCQRGPPAPPAPASP